MDARTGFSAFFGSSLARLPLIGSSISRWPSTRFFGFLPLPLAFASAGADRASFAGCFSFVRLRFNAYQVGMVTRWTPVKNLTFSAEVQYFRLDQNFTGTATLTPTAPKPATVYEFKDQDTVSLQLRAQRNF